MLNQNFEQVTNQPLFNRCHAASEPSIDRWIHDFDAVSIRLEELFPADPGQLSGMTLCLSDLEETWLSAYAGTHQLGFMTNSTAFHFARRALAGESLIAKMLGPHSVGEDRYDFNGAELRFESGEKPEMRLCFGTHCLGILRGLYLTQFLDLIIARTRPQVSGRKVIVLVPRSEMPSNLGRPKA